MKIIKIDKNNFTKEEIDLIVAALQQEKVVVLPTDTIYGLHTRADSEKAIRRIIKIKERPSGFGFVHLMKSYCQVHEYCKVSAKQDKALREYWPKTTRDLQNKEEKFMKKPSTVILENKSNLPNIGRGGQNSMAVRLPKDDFLLTIIKRLNIPLVSSSFNISGKDAVDFAKIEKEFAHLPDLIVDAGKFKKQASRIIDIRDVENIRILRK